MALFSLQRVQPATQRDTENLPKKPGRNNAMSGFFSAMLGLDGEVMAAPASVSYDLSLAQHKEPQSGSRAKTRQEIQGQAFAVG